MGERLDLSAKFKEILGSDNVYFQPPASIKMRYPAIVYSLKNLGNTHANDSVYRQLPEYQVIVIDRNPDSEIMRKVSVLPYCRFDRYYAADNLNHYVFSIHY
jgi:hypothetical protein